MQPDPVTAPRLTPTVLLATLLGAGAVQALARLAGFGVLLAVVAASVGLMTVGVLVLRLLVLR